MRSPRSLLSAGNVRARKQLGQNFLNDSSVARAIVNQAAIGGEDVVLEIGPGLGAMTAPAAAVAHRVIAVDKDARIVGLLRSELSAAAIDNVDIREGDILRVDFVSVAREAGRRLE
jgi:16S rRNA (adenine1518-N6/adenine1519-N6)-dimethyltransferase